jgi:hypothetical protein
VIGANNVWVLLGNGSGGFSGPVSYPLESSAGPSSIAIGDISGDGKPDLAVTEEQKRRVAVLAGDGLGAFAAPVFYAVGSQPTGVTIADLNDDGARDLAVANSTSETVSILINSGAGTLNAGVEYGASQAGSVVAADFNSDTRIDLATDGIDILFNTCPASTVGLSELSIADVTVNEESGTASLSVSLSAAGSGTTSISYYTLGQSAVSGIDFQPLREPWYLTRDKRQRIFVVPILNDSSNELH